MHSNKVSNHTQTHTHTHTHIYQTIGLQRELNRHVSNDNQANHEKFFHWHFLMAYFYSIVICRVQITGHYLRHSMKYIMIFNFLLWQWNLNCRCWQFWMNLYINILNVLGEILDKFEMNIMNVKYSKTF
jgi:hypothetical protein